MARFAVEIRNSRGVSKDKPVRGYLGFIGNPHQRDEDGEPKSSLGVRSVETIKDTDGIPFFETAGDARRAIRDMPDAFFDVYETNVVEL